MIAAYLSTCLTALVSAFFPITPVEPYLLGLVAATGIGPVGLGIAAAVGQTIGKTLIFLGARGVIRSESLHRLTRLVFRRKRVRERSSVTVPDCAAGSSAAASDSADSTAASDGVSAAGVSAASAEPSRIRRLGRSLRERLGLWAGPVRRRVRRLGGPVKAAASKLTDLLERPALTVPILFLSAVTGIPPLIATSVYIAGTRISTPVFATVCLVGRSVRFIAIAYAPQLILG